MWGELAMMTNIWETCKDKEQNKPGLDLDLVYPHDASMIDVYMSCITWSHSHQLKLQKNVYTYATNRTYLPLIISRLLSTNTVI